MKKNANLFRVGAILLTSCLTIGGFAATQARPSQNQYIMTANAAVDGQELSYIVTNGTVTIVDASASVTNIVVPSTIDGYPVTSIGNSAFLGCSELISISLPSSVTNIDNGAFGGCSALLSVSLPSNLTRIGYEAFSGCSSFTSITIPDGVSRIERETFSGCTNLRNVTFSNHTESIGESAFSGCTSLQAIDFKNINEIGANAFNGCAALTSVTVPGSVDTISMCAFAKCTGLKTFVVKNGVKKIESYVSGNGILANCTAIQSITLPYVGTTLDDANATDRSYYLWHMFNCSESDSTYNIGLRHTPKSLKTIKITGGNRIPTGAFSGLSGVTTISIPGSITTIGNGAFSGCESLKAIQLPTVLTEIGNGAFTKCLKLKTVELPSGLTTICGSAFRECTGLTSMTIPALVNEMGSYAFYGCSALETVEIKGQALTTICEFTFAGCKKLARITLPTSLTRIQAYAFSGCTALESVHYAAYREDWNKISIHPANSELKEATMFFAAAQILTQPKNITALNGSTATFSIRAIGEGLQYKWQFSRNNGETWSKLNTESTYSVTAISARNGYCYRCIIKDQYGNTVTSAVAKLTVKTVATIQTQPKNITALNGSAATFSIRAIGDGLTYKWQFSRNNGETWSKLNTEPTYSVTAISARNGYCYRCIIKDQYGNTVTSAVAKLTVKTVATIQTQPKSITAQNGSTATFSIRAIGDGLTYKWQFSRNNGETWSKLNTEPTYSVTAISARNGYCYRCIIKDQYGNTVTSAVAKLTVI